MYPVAWRYKKEKEILDFILYELHSGATNYHAYGAYTNEMHTEIVTIVAPADVSA